MPPPPEGDALLAIADRFEPRLRRAFLDAVAAGREGTVLRQVRAALERGDLSGAYRAIGWEGHAEPALRGPFLADWRAALEAAGTATAERLTIPPPPPIAPPGMPGAPGGPPRRFVFEVLNPRPLRFLEQHGAALVTEVSEPTREALRRSLVQMHRLGWDTRTAATDLMGHLGLTTRLAQANINYRRRLIEQGLRLARIDDLVARHALRLLRYRATVIARTEPKLAVGNGQRLAWEQAIAEGRLDPHLATVIWQTAKDEQVCPICGPMDRQTRTIAELAAGTLFVTGEGELVEFPAETHPQCRCSRSMRATGLVRGRLGDVVRIRAQQRGQGGRAA